MNGRLALVWALEALLLPEAAAAQEYKAVTVGLGADFARDSTAYTFDFVFNQPEGDDPADPRVLVILGSQTASTHWYFAPVATASFGNGVKTASNNLTLRLPFTAQLVLNRGGNERRGRPVELLNIRLTPVNLATDKDISTALLYASLGADLFYRQWVRKRPDGSLRALQWSLRIGTRADGGGRLRGSSYASGVFFRAVPSTSWALKWRRYVNLSATGQLFLLANDQAFPSKTTRGLFKSELALRFRGRGSDSEGAEPGLFPLGIGMKYTRGRDEPGYEYQNVLTVGLAFYTR